ncbi:MAG: hypothetical protein F6J97_24505 [Leptolyngbya sp. SIO4C1]|nr:hypothetical protein [Leptolyngbya sp. SIO4C1]
MWKVLAHSDIKADDPTFLIMVAVRTIEVLTAEIPKQLVTREAILTQLSDQINEQLKDFEQITNEITLSSRTLERKLKAQLPKISRNSTPKLKELAVAVAIAFLAGGIFFRPLVRVTRSASCERVPILCLDSETLE